MKIFLNLIIKIVSLILVAILLIPFCMPVSYAETDTKSMSILFTNDMHDHLLPVTVEQNGVVSQSGGYARLQTAINQAKHNKSNVVLVDAGDYSMGTLFQSIYSTDAPELRIMGELGYDVVTFGNHEFDFRDNGLASNLYAAKNSGGKVPQIVNSNILFSKNMSKSQLDLKNAMESYGVKEYTVIEKSGVKIGVFGLLGKDAADSAPLAGVAFEDEVESAKKTVDKLKNEEKVDLIVCLSHSGIWTDKSVSEDEILAKNVPNIDIIISAHTHTKLEKPIVVGNTTIGSSGEYCGNLGIMDITQQANGRWKLDEYKLRPIDASLENNVEVDKKVEAFKKIVQQKYLDNFGMKFDDVLAKSTFSFTPTSEIGLRHQEDSLGNLISDAYMYAVKKAEGEDYEPVTAAIVPAGTIRGSFIKGDIMVSDAFTASSLGIGSDGISGYPIISVYLTGKELKATCEVDASITDLMSSAQLYMSGVDFTFNPNRLIFNKVTAVSIKNPDGSLQNIDDSKLYRIVAGLYSGQMLSIVGEKSFGLLSVVPKDKEGKPITDFEKHIIYDKSSGRNNEVKEWLAIAQYLKTFDRVDGIPQISDYYSKPQGRKIVDDNSNIFAILRKPNSIALTIYAAIVGVVALVIFVVYRIFTRNKRKQKKQAKKKIK